MTLGQDLWDTIAIIITLNLLHQDFNSTTASLLETSNKMIGQIESILQSKKAKNHTKRAIEDTSDLAIAFEDKREPKKKANSDNKCYNYYKLGHVQSEYFFSDRKLNKTTTLTSQSRREKS